MKIKKYKATFIVCSVITITISAMIMLLILINIYLEPYYQPNKEKIEKYFKQDKKNLVLVKDYIANNTVLSYISALDFKSKNYSKLINDEKVIFAFNYLLKKQGYIEIGKQKNTIYFLKWTRGSNLGIGIAYSINNENQPELEYVTKLEPLSENGWYFYESDYSKWKTQ